LNDALEKRAKIQIHHNAVLNSLKGMCDVQASDVQAKDVQASDIQTSPQPLA
jgi:hypothetical protein